MDETWTESEVKSHLSLCKQNANIFCVTQVIIYQDG
nr:MAG TPA: hypothetical protein [Caudoviricetes sp.]